MAEAAASENGASGAGPGSEAPTVSIITPTYNHQRFIGQCIESVLAQSFASWELVIIDDGSTDATPEIVRGYADPRIRYVRQENLGIERLPEIYNRALALARGSLVAILEGDDYWPADKLATQVPAFADPDVVLAYGWTEVVGKRGKLFPPRIPGADFEQQIPAGVLTNTPVGHAALGMCDYRWLTFTYPVSVVMRRSALDRIGGFQGPRGLRITDHPTFLRLSLEGRFHYERRTLGYWRVHDAGTTVRDMDRILERLHPEILRFRAEHGHRLGITDEQWRQIDAGWVSILGWTALRGARRLMLDERWSEARPHLWRAMRGASWRTRLVALTALAGSRVEVPAEWIFRLTGKPWFRRVGPDKVDIVLPQER